MVTGWLACGWVIDCYRNYRRPSVSFWLIAEGVSWHSSGSPSLCLLSVTTLRGYKLRKNSLVVSQDWILLSPHQSSICGSWARIIQ